MRNLNSLGFKFKVGDIAYHRLSHMGSYQDEKTFRTPVLIVERMATECVSGVQLNYSCRLGVSGRLAATTFEPTKLFVLNEIELEP